MWNEDQKIPWVQVMRKKQPEAESALGKYVEDSVQDDLSVHVNRARPVGETPDTESC